MLNKDTPENSEKMSDHSESGSENGNSGDICRDYLRNVCKRGLRCKYRHPGEQEATEYKKISEYTFCHDFQNNGCRRQNCKFLHCSREEEEHARQTGELPSRMMQAAALGIGVNHQEMVAKGGVPVCKDNLKGECHRGVGCKYRHISSSEYEYLQRKSEARDRELFPARDPLSPYDRFDRFEFENESVKRRRLDPEFGSESFRSFENRYASLSPNSRPLSYQLLEDENTMLRRKVEELKKQVADLTATNEVLLEQNARYRVSKSNLIQSLNPTGSLQPGGASALQATSLSALNTTLAQQIALGTELSISSLNQQQALQQQQQQRIVRELAAGQPGQCSIAAPPQSLNTVTLSMNPPSVVPVSLPQPPPSVPGGLQQQSANQNNVMAPQNLDMNAAASLVSYPIVSQQGQQGLRMTTSSLAH